MSGHHDDDRTLPRWLLLAVAGLIGFAVLSASLHRWQHLPETVDNNERPAASRDLRFVDVGGGVVSIHEWPEGHHVATLDAGTENFIRGVLRGLARERRALGLDHEQPFRIARFEDGRVTLEDLATGRVLFLNAFGVTNVAAFNNLIDAGRSASIPPDPGSAG